jgi:thioredoxin-related protein
MNRNQLHVNVNNPNNFTKLSFGLNYTKRLKYIILLGMFLFNHVSVFASDNTIAFTNVGYNALFATAKREHKGVMLYFHFDGCGACHKMENSVFKDPKVVTFFNKHFVNFEINTYKREGMLINKHFNIHMHPTFILYDTSGNEIHRMVGLFTPEEFYKQASEALFSKKNLTNYNKRYEEGNRQPDFLYEYAYMLRDAQALDSVVVNDYLNAIDTSDYVQKKNLHFMYEFCVHNFKICIPIKNPRFNFMLKNKKLFNELFDSNQVNMRIVWILNSAIYNAIEDKNEKAFTQYIDMLKPYDNGEKRYFKEIDGRTTGMLTSKSLVLLSWLNYYEKINDIPNFHKTGDAYLAKFHDDSEELNNFAWEVCESTDTLFAEKIKLALRCSIRSIALKDNYANNDTYACLLYRSGDTKNALKQAKKAITLAKKEKEDYGLTELLIDRIKKE